MPDDVFQNALYSASPAAVQSLEGGQSHRDAKGTALDVKRDDSGLKKDWKGTKKDSKRTGLGRGLELSLTDRTSSQLTNGKSLMPGTTEAPDPEITFSSSAPRQGEQLSPKLPIPTCTFRPEL
jgi:hypothetical protein